MSICLEGNIVENWKHTDFEESGLALDTEDALLFPVEISADWRDGTFTQALTWYSVDCLIFRVSSPSTWTWTWVAITEGGVAYLTSWSLLHKGDVGSDLETFVLSSLSDSSWISGIELEKVTVSLDFVGDFPLGLSAGDFVISDATGGGGGGGEDRSLFCCESTTVVMIGRRMLL